jgi:hypothetical protein
VENTEIDPVHHHHTGRPWLDLILGISAVSISFISLFLAVHNGRAMERLVQANSWPYIQVTYSNSNPDGTPHFHLDIANKGVGPATVESLEVLYDGKPMSDSRSLLNALLNRTTTPMHPPLLTSGIINFVLAAKEQVTFLDLTPSPEVSAQDYDAIRAGAEKLEFVSCYCSVFDECWVIDTRIKRPAQVKTCPVPSTPFHLG